MFNVRLAGGHLYGKQLFTWLSLVVSLMASFVLSFFPLDVLDEIWDLIESVSEGFLTYSYKHYISIYTDGSKQDEKVACAVISPNFMDSIRLPDNGSILPLKPRLLILHFII